jgi:hypothetical protein
MKMSLRLMIWGGSAGGRRQGVWRAYVLVSQVLQQLELAVSALGQDWSAEGLHDLLDGDGLAGELVLCRAAVAVSGRRGRRRHARAETYQTRPKAPMPTGCRSVYLLGEKSVSGERAVRGTSRTCS